MRKHLRPMAIHLSNNEMLHSSNDFPLVFHRIFFHFFQMDNNLICNIRGAPFNHLSRLRVLSLKSNRMTSVTEYAFQKLRNNVALLDIDGNPLSCSCKMLWLINWLDDVQSEGPKCADGTLFRDVRLSREECGKSRVIEPVIPGCEGDTVQSSVVETAQLSALTSHLKNSTQGLLPHETDYFYDEYIEYQYEEINGTQPQYETSFGTTENPITVTKKTYHMTPGDTPTLYASPATQPKFNLTNPGLGMDDVKKAQQQQQQYSGLTFFGIPLPSLSFGNLWKGNSARSVDQTQKNSFVIGKVQPLPKKPDISTIQPVIKSQTEVNFIPTVPVKTDFSTVIDTNTKKTHSTLSSPILQGIVTPVEKPNTLKTTQYEDFISDQTGIKLTTVSTEPYIAKLHLNTELVSPVSRNTTVLEVGTLPPWSTLSVEEPKYTVPDYDYAQWNQKNILSTTSIPETTKDIFHVDDIKLNDMNNKKNNWYFENYNKTNLEPYIGINIGSSNTRKILIWKILLFMSFLLVIR